MNSDLIVIATGWGAFILFFALHLLVLRFTRREEILKVLTQLYLFCSAVLTVSGIFFLERNLVFILLSFIICTLTVAIYIIGVFGLIESSVRIRILDLINGKGQYGLTRSSLQREYNMNLIVEKRLKRLVSSGEIIYSKGYYRRFSRFSFIYIPYAITKIMWWAYNGESI